MANKSPYFDSASASVHVAEIVRGNFGGLTGGGGGPHDSSMEQRVATLESEFRHVRKDMDEMKGDMKTVIAKIDDVRVNMTSKRDNWTMIGIVFGASLSMIMIVVGVIALFR